MSDRTALLDEIDGEGTKYPGKVPAIVQRDPHETSLPVLPKPKMLLPEDFTHSQLVTLVRQRLRAEKHDAQYLYLRYDGARDQGQFYTSTLGQLHKKFAKPDGLLHVYYTSHPPEAPSESCCSCTIV